MTYKPWLPDAAIEEIDQYLKELEAGDDPVYIMEHGAGHSTPWLAKRGDYLLSFETDPKWYSRIGSILKKELLLDHTDLIFASMIPEMGIKLPKNAPREYDLILVDGRGRVKFWDKAKKFLKPGGMVVWDDAERTKYWPRTELIKMRFEMVKMFHKPEKPHAYTLTARKPNEA
jgi:predicted O-methyltransferase YrrM